MSPSRRSFGREKADPERGSVVVLLAILLPVLLAFVALAVDVGYVAVTKNELQNASDAAALAAARKLGSLYQTMTYEAQQTYVADGDRPSIVSTAQQVALQNAAAGKAVALLDAEVKLGRWKNKTFTPTNVQPDAVRVIARRDTQANGPASTFFARVFGTDTFVAAADAIAALTGQSTADPGEVELPIGISSWFFERETEDGYCDKDVKFYPTNDPDSCAGWTSWDLNSNDANLRKILEGIPGYDNPGIIAGETFFNFTGGTLSNPTFNTLLLLFKEKGYDVDANWNYIVKGDGNRLKDANLEPHPDAVPLLDSGGVQLRYPLPDGSPRWKHKWETSIPIYGRGDCSNPNQSIKIVGFARIELRDVLDAPSKLVRGRIKCNYVGAEDNRGSGGNYGLKGSIPGLVE